MTDREPTMAETTDQPTPPITPESWQWAFSYLREDVQDIRTDLRELRAEIRQGLSEVSQRPGDRGVETNHQVSSRLTECDKQLLRHIDTRFTWTITTMLAIAGLMAALIKL